MTSDTEIDYRPDNLGVLFSDTNLCVQSNNRLQVEVATVNSEGCIDKRVKFKDLEKPFTVQRTDNSDVSYCQALNNDKTLYFPTNKEDKIILSPCLINDLVSNRNPFGINHNLSKAISNNNFEINSNGLGHYQKMHIKSEVVGYQSRFQGIKICS